MRQDHHRPTPARHACVQQAAPTSVVSPEQHPLVLDILAIGETGVAVGGRTDRKLRATSRRRCVGHLLNPVERGDGGPDDARRWPFRLPLLQPSPAGPGTGPRRQHSRREPPRGRALAGQGRTQVRRPCRHGTAGGASSGSGRRALRRQRDQLAARAWPRSVFRRSDNAWAPSPYVSGSESVKPRCCLPHRADRGRGSPS